MIKIASTSDAAQRHVDAVMKRVQTSYRESAILAHVQQLGVDTIEEFLLADVTTMRRWTQESPDKLNFLCFREIYSSYFCNGANKYVDGDYNAYSFLRALEITVCPYCEDEYLDIVTIADTERRTSEVDHFFPKSKYPALAMCYYNLIPSGQNCNGLKREQALGVNPYEKDIESLTFLYPDIPVGKALEAIKPEECRVRFHPKKGMAENVRILALEDRYVRHAPEAHRLLRNVQMYNEEKIQEMMRMDCGTREHILCILFGPQDPNEKKNALRQKMLRDITGY